MIWAEMSVCLCLNREATPLILSLRSLLRQHCFLLRGTHGSIANTSRITPRSIAQKVSLAQFPRISKVDDGYYKFYMDEFHNYNSMVMCQLEERKQRRLCKGNIVQARNSRIHATPRCLHFSHEIPSTASITYHLF